MPDAPHINSGADKPMLHQVASTAGDNRLLFSRYEIGRLLGYGAFAKVYYAHDTNTGGSVAIKSISKRQIVKGGHVDNIKREIAILHRVRHQHIIRLQEVLATRSKIFFVMEYARGGELFDKVKRGRFSEDLSRKYFQQLISAISYCHERGIFHRDLKPENLLLDEKWSLRVTDFGLSAVKDQIRPDGRLHTLCGTPAYVAPEILAKQGYDGAKSDVWSCGIILFVLNAGYLPFNDSNLMAMYRKICIGEFRCPKWTSPDLKHLLSRLLDTNPETRISVDEIMRDPWFKKNLNEAEFRGSEMDGLKLEEEREEKARYMNAFDLIWHSSGFNNAGFFAGKSTAGVSPIYDYEESFVSAEEPKRIVEKVEAAAKEAQGVKVEKKDWGVRIEGQDGNFAVVVGVNRLTEKLVVIEVKRREVVVGAAGCGLWKRTLMPLICGLLYEPTGPAGAVVTG